MTTRPLAYVIESRQVGGHWCGFIIAKCSGCDKPTEIHWNANNNPHHISKHFKRLGWDFDPYKLKGNRCPGCNKPVFLAHNSEPDLSTFGKRLHWTREQAHLSLDQLADETGINRQLLQHIEQGKNDKFNLEDAAAIRLSDTLVSHGAIVDANWLSGITEKPNILAINLRRHMALRSFTEGTLSTETHVPPSQIKMMLSGALDTHYKIADIAKALRCQPADLLGHVPEPPPVVPAPVVKEPRRAIGNALATTGLFKSFFGDKPGEALREARVAKGLSQGQLAGMIFGRPGANWTVGSIQAMISGLERKNSLTPSNTKLIGIALACLDEPEPVQNLPDPVKQKPNGHALPVVDQEAIRTALRSAENDLVELRKMLDDIEPLRQMVLETTQKIESIKAQLAVLPAPDTTAEHLRFVRGMWHFRRRVPVDARTVFGLTEFDADLATANKWEALQRKMPYERAFDQKLAEARAHETSLHTV